MRSKQELTAMADALVSLIRKHGGWIEQGEIIRFPSVSKREQFEAALEAGKASSNVDVWEAAIASIDGE